MPPRLAQQTARALDRLAWRAHAFHRYAHHPLCGRYASEVIPLGRRARVCRGCAFTALGVLAGSVTACVVTPSALVLALSAFIGLTLACLSIATRLPKSLGRGLATAAGTFACISGLLTPNLGGRVASGSLIGLAGLISWLYRRRGPNRAPCESCPERTAKGPCSGLKPMVQRERAFQRVAQRQIDAALSSQS